MPDIERSRSVRFRFMLYAQFGVINKDIISFENSDRASPL